MATSSTARKRQAPDTATDTPNRANKRAPSKFKRFLRLVLLVLIIIAASVGATLYYTWPAGASLFSFLPNSTATEPEVAVIEEVVQTPAAPTPVSTKPLFVRLDPFTVTITEGGSRTRILHVAITLQVANDSTQTLLDEYMPVVRDRVLRILSEQHPQYIQTPEGREQLVATLKHALNQSFDQRSANPDVSHVLFTAFVIQ